VAKDITYRLREATLGALRGTAMSAYEARGSGRFASRFITDIEVIDQFIGDTVARFVTAVFALTGIAVVLFLLSWKLALLILFLNPIIVMFTVVLGRRVRELKRRENSAFEALQDTLIETLDAIQQLRAANREDYYLARIGERSRSVRDQAFAHAWLSDAAARVSSRVFAMAIDIFRVGALAMVLVSGLSLGEMTAVFSYLWLMQSYVRDVFALPYAWFAASAALKRVDALSRLDKEVGLSGTVDPFVESGQVGLEVRDLCFSYEGGPPVIDHLSLRIEPGEKVALVGTSGGGKSTLVQLLLGLYTPDSGDILFGGVSVADIGLETVRRNVTAVLQHPAMMNASVRENLSLGQSLEDSQLWEALEIAQLSNDIRALPQGLDSVLGRQGVRFSGGQRQRLAIARMILGHPRLVILDEASSALDTETEANLHEALAGYLKGRTCLIIAHRLSSIRQADRVYVFDGGRIVEHGRHDDLIGQDGLYQRLYGKARV
jgi:ATP-binding cassette subfamily C protein